MGKTAINIMKKAMKRTVMKKAMKKAMKKRVSKYGKFYQVMNGTKEKTKGGLKKTDLVKSKSTGKAVSKKKSANGTKHYKNISTWVSAFNQARKELGITGFVAIKKGTPFYKRTKELMSKSPPLL